MNLKYIFKILDKNDWNNAKKKGNYSGSVQDLKDGYIHFSEEEQIHETLKKHYAVSYTHLTLPTNREV